SLTVIGGGVIGCEFASLLTDLGVAVEIVEFLPDLVSSEDREISRRLLAALRKKGIRVHLHNAVNNIEMEKGKVRLHLSSGQIINTSKVLLSVGRNPVMSISFTDGGPAEEKGFIRVNNEMRTNLSNVFAIGDVTGKLMLAHTASKQGMIVADIIRSQLRGDSGIGWDLEYTDIPRCTYTTPEIGSVGLTEEQARMKFGEIRMGRFLFSACGKAIAIRQTFGFVKIISTVDGAIVGLHIIGPQATELIAQGAILLGMKAGLTDVKKIVFAHPTLSEAIMEACEDSEGLAIHKI
ncbi:MAG: FAD-dependent oxidoreductase, partial [Candidatus Cloacimonetes bacterium]|nr:FAD-dependent oxidoreductase [Candidatus Cloacimonadota bacterium]